METDGSFAALNKMLEGLRSSDIKIGDKYKILNEFVRKAHSLNFEEIISLVKPVDFLSRRLCISIACAFKNLDYIIHILKTAEMSVLRTALRNKKNAWLYGKDSAFSDPDFLIHELFPVISFTSRQIILTRVPRFLNDEEKCASIFEAVAAKYGFQNTGDLIMGCSPEYILKVTRDGQVRLTDLQLKPLLSKYPNLVQEYLIDYFKSKRIRNKNFDHNVLQSIASPHPAMLITLLEFYHEPASRLRLKPEVSRQILRIGKTQILQNPRKYAQFIDKAVAYEQLTRDEYMLLFASTWPTSIHQFENQSEFCPEDYILFPEWLKPLPTTKDKGDLVQEIFLHKYGMSILDNNKCIHYNLLTLLPADARTKLAESNIAKFHSPNRDFFSRHLASLISYKSIDKSIPEIKELIFHESDASLRCGIINSLIHTCAINEDKAALAQVCVYYVTRHRNERNDIHGFILRDIVRQFDLSEFNTETWTAVIGLIQLILVTQSDDTYYQDEFNNVIEHLYVFQTLNPEEAAAFKSNEMLHRLLKRKLSGSSGYTKTTWETGHIMKLGLSQKNFFGIVMKELEDLYPRNKFKSGSTEYRNAEERIMQLLSCFQECNKKMHRKQQRVSVLDFPWMEEKVNEILANHKEFETRDKIISHLVSDPILKKDELALCKYLEICATPTILIYFLRNNPKLLAKNWKIIESRLFQAKLQSETLKYVELTKWHGYTELCKKPIEKCKLELQATNKLKDEDIRPQSVAMLSILLDSAEFLDTVKPYLPQTSTINLENERDTKDVLVRSTIASSLKNLEFSGDGLPALLKFCAGDYLKFAVDSMYSLSYRADQGRLFQFLSELSGRAVSIKKHRIRLICRLSTQEVVYGLYKTMIETDQQDSIRHILLMYLFKTGTSWSWSAINSLVSTLRVTDMDSLKELTKQGNIDKIPTSVLDDYFTIVWNKFRNLDNKGQDLHTPKLVIAIGDNMERLPNSYMKAFIENNLFSPDLSISVLNEVSSLFVKYILSRVSTNLAENLEVLQTGFQKLDKPTKKYRAESNITAITRNRKLLSHFVTAFTEALQIDPIKVYPMELFQGILNLEAFELQALLFEEFLALRFLFVLNFADRDQDFVTAGHELVAHLDTIIKKYGKQIVTLFGNTLESALKSVKRTNPDVNLVSLIAGILDSKSNNLKELTLVALKLLPKKPEMAGHLSTQAEFKRIVDKIFSSSDPLILSYAYNWIE